MPGRWPSGRLLRNSGGSFRLINYGRSPPNRKRARRSVARLDRAALGAATTARVLDGQRYHCRCWPWPASGCGCPRGPAHGRAMPTVFIDSDRLRVTEWALRPVAVPPGDATSSPLAVQPGERTLGLVELDLERPPQLLEGVIVVERRAHPIVHIALHGQRSVPTGRHRSTAEGEGRRQEIDLVNL